MRLPPPVSNVRHQSRMRMVKKRDLNHPSSTINLEYCTQVSVIKTTARAQNACEKKLSIVTMIIERSISEKSTARHAHCKTKEHGNMWERTSCCHHVWGIRNYCHCWRGRIEHWQVFSRNQRTVTPPPPPKKLYRPYGCLVDVTHYTL